MSTPPTTNGRASDGAQAPPAGTAPPHSIEAEQSVLGAMLLSDRTHYAFVIEEGLKVDDFYRERHREVYESMLALFTAGDSIDVLTVTEHLRSRGRLEAAGGQAEIDALTASVPAVGNLRQYAQIVRDRALLRRLLDRLLRDPGPRPRSRGSAARARRMGRARRPRGRPRRPPEGLPPGRRGPPRRGPQVAGALRRGPLAHRHAVGLRRPRRDHRRLPARQPDHHRGKAVDGQMPQGLGARLRPDDRRAPAHGRRRRAHRGRRGGPRCERRLRSQAARDESHGRTAQRRTPALSAHDAPRAAHRGDREPPAADDQGLAPARRARVPARASPCRGAYRGPTSSRRCPTTRSSCSPPSSPTAASPSARRDSASAPTRQCSTRCRRPPPRSACV